MLEDVKIINLPKITDPRGNLSFFENDSQIPFKIKRTYWIYDIPTCDTRGSHAFKESVELIIALSGSFNVVINDGKYEKKFGLNSPYNALYVPNKLWRKLDNFSSNSSVLIVSSVSYNENDYIRDFNVFKKYINEIS